MLAKINRLQKTKEIERVFKKGEGVKEGLLILKTVKNNLENSRFGFIVSQKVSKKANLRNKVKRRLRDLVKGRLKKIKRGKDNLLIVLPGLERKSFKEIEETINKLFKKAKIMEHET
jgi:ribonuclease P protein component